MTGRTVVAALMARHGRTFCDELGIPIARNTPSPLFRWLVAAILYSARIRVDNATKAAAALSRAGWTTPAKMAASDWADRVAVLNAHGYARYDESTARMLGDTAERVERDYRGDLRRLRDAAERAPRAERRLLKSFKGLGTIGVSIFFRETQSAWPELYPFADKKALGAAAKLGLPTTGPGLAELVGEADYPRLVAALVRCDLARDHKQIIGR